MSNRRESFRAALQTKRRGNRAGAMPIKDDTIFPYRPYKGRQINKVPAKYLKWLHNKLRNDNTIKPLTTRSRLLEYLNQKFN